MVLDDGTNMIVSNDLRPMSFVPGFQENQGMLANCCSQASDAPALDAKANKYAAIWLQRKRIKESMVKSSTEKRWLQP